MVWVKWFRTALLRRLWAILLTLAWLGRLPGFVVSSLARLVRLLDGLLLQVFARAGAGGVFLATVGALQLGLLRALFQLVVTAASDAPHLVCALALHVSCALTLVALHNSAMDWFWFEGSVSDENSTNRIFLHNEKSTILLLALMCAHMKEVLELYQLFN